MAREKVALDVSSPERSGMKQISSLLVGCGPAEGGRQARQGYAGHVAAFSRMALRHLINITVVRPSYSRVVKSRGEADERG